MRSTTTLIIAAAVIMACSQADREIEDAPADAEPAAAPVVDPRGARLAALPAPYNAADLANGARLYRRCSNCHMIAPEGRALVGPNLYGVFERRVGAGAGFQYSQALQEADFVWTPERLDAWLTSPRDVLPGNRMAFAGVPDRNDRRDIIAHILIESGFRGADDQTDGDTPAEAAVAEPAADGYTVIEPEAAD